MRKVALWILAGISLAQCAGWKRCASSCSASSFGANWLVVQYRNDGTPIRCWRLDDVSISNEDKSDGIYWQGRDGNLVHLSGWYNRVQVADWTTAAKHLGVPLESCTP